MGSDDNVDIVLSNFLKSLDLTSYLPIFKKEEVTYKILSEMDEKDLQDLGIPFGSCHGYQYISKS